MWRGQGQKNNKVNILKTYYFWNLDERYTGIFVLTLFQNKSYSAQVSQYYSTLVSKYYTDFMENGMKINARLEE